MLARIIKTKELVDLITWTRHSVTYKVGGKHGNLIKVDNIDNISKFIEIA